MGKRKNRHRQKAHRNRRKKTPAPNRSSGGGGAPAEDDNTEEETIKEETAKEETTVEGTIKEETTKEETIEETETEAQIPTESDAKELEEEEEELKAGAKATSGKCGDNLTWKFANNTLTISGTGAMFDYRSGTAPWNWICESEEKNIKLVISNGVTSIGNYAFWECWGLKRCLIIPNSVTSIGDEAFVGCSGFTGSLTIPSSVTSIGDSAFACCSGFTGSLTIPSGVTSIGDFAFWYCGFTGSLTIPSSVTSFGDKAFYGCRELTSLIISNGVTSIGNNAFLSCTGLTGRLIIPSSVTSIEDGAFASCSGLTSIIIPNSVTGIGNMVFANCSGLTSLVIPSSVTTIEQYAFYNCNGLTSLIIPNSVAVIAQHAFENCENLTDIYMPKSLRYIFGNPFQSGDGWSYTNLPLTFHSPKDSYTYTWAKDNGFNVVEWDDTPSEIKDINSTSIICVDIELDENGAVQKPDADIWADGKKLVKDADYTLEYPDNGSDAYKAAGVYKIVATGKGTYTGSREVKFTIRQQQDSGEIWGDIIEEDRPADGIIPDGVWIAGVKSAGYSYTGEAVIPQVRVYSGNVLLAEKINYTISFKNNVNAGSGTITVTGKGIYSWQKKETFTILPVDINECYAEEFYVKINSKKKQNPVPVLYYMGNKLKVNKDFTVDASGIYAIAGQNYSVTITGKGNFKETKPITLTAVAKIVKKPTPSITRAKLQYFETSFIYTGKALEQESALIIRLGVRPAVEQWLALGDHYTIGYSNNIKAGTATVTYYGKNGYSGKLKKTYRILPYDIKDDAEHKIECYITPECAYVQGGAKPQPVVKFDGKVLKEGVDYTLSYKNNKAVRNADAKNAPCVTINGKGNFKGKIIESFSITP